MSAVLSVRVPEALKDDLDFLAGVTKRSRAYLAQEALKDYLALHAWRARELHEAMSEADKGVFVSNEAVEAWVTSLGTVQELPAPKPDVFPGRNV